MNCRTRHSTLSGAISVPGSKSHTIRACLLAAMAEGTSFIRNPLPSADCLSAARCIAEIGAKVEMTSDNKDTFGTRLQLPNAGAASSWSW